MTCEDCHVILVPVFAPHTNRIKVIEAKINLHCCCIRITYFLLYGSYKPFGWVKIIDRSEALLHASAMVTLSMCITIFTFYDSLQPFSSAAVSRNFSLHSAERQSYHISSLLSSYIHTVQLGFKTITSNEPVTL